jgi:tetratricopeptide (TPR) repeat protein
MFAALSDQRDLVITQLYSRPGDGPPPVKSLSAKMSAYLSDVQAGGFTPDEQDLVTMDLDGHVEIRDVGSGAPMLLKIAVQGARKSAMARTCRSVAFADAAGNVSCWEVPALPRSEQARFVRLVKSYCYQKRYDHLEALGVLLESDSGAFPWRSYDLKYSTMVTGFAPSLLNERKPEDSKQFLSDWLKARPNSALARVLEGRRLLAEGWKARGSGFAGSVRPEGWEVLHKSLQEMETIILPMADSNDCPPDTYCLVFEIAKNQGWEPERLERYIDALLRQADWYFPAHGAMVEMRMPRWGGRAGDSEKYARRVADHLGGEQGAAIYARLALRMSCYYGVKELFETEQFDYEKILTGLRQLLRQYPDDLYMLYETMRIAYMHNDRETARDCWDRIQRQRMPGFRGMWTAENLGKFRKWLGVNEDAGKPESR